MLRRIALAASGLLLLGVSGPKDRQITDPHSIQSTPNSGARPVAIEDLFFSRNVGSPAWSPNGREIVFSTDFTGRNNLWKVSAAGGWPIQLAVSDDWQYGAVWSPDGSTIVFQQDRGGGEIYDLFSIPSAGGTAVNLTQTNDISETDPRFSPGGKLLAISYKPKTSPTPDIALLDLATRKVRNVTNEQTKDHPWSFVAWGPDGKNFYANRTYIDQTDGDIYRVDMRSGKRENLTPHQGKLLFAAKSLSQDGRTLVIETNESGFQNVALLDTGSHKITPVPIRNGRPIRATLHRTATHSLTC